MKRLLILRHAKSSWDDGNLGDHERPLNARGNRDAPRMGRLLADQELRPEVVLSSDATRARSTAEAVVRAGQLEASVSWVPNLYLAPAGTCIDILQQLSDDVDCALLVGHNPGLEQLVDHLAGDCDHFPTAALAWFDIEIDHWRDLSLTTSATLKALWRPRELP